MTDFFSYFFLFIETGGDHQDKDTVLWIREKTMEGPLNLWGHKYYLPNWTLEYS